MELRAGDRTGHAGRADTVAAIDYVALVDVHVPEVGIGRDVAVGVADEDEVAVALDARPHIDNLAILGGADRRAFRRLDIDAGALGIGEVRDDASRDGPAELLCT